MLVAVCAHRSGGGGSGDRVGGGARAYTRSRRLLLVEVFLLYLLHCINLYLEYLSYFFTASAYYCAASFGEAHTIHIYLHFFVFPVNCQARAFLPVLHSTVVAHKFIGK